MLTAFAAAVLAALSWPWPFQTYLTLAPHPVTDPWPMQRQREKVNVSWPRFLHTPTTDTVPLGSVTSCIHRTNQSPQSAHSKRSLNQTAACKSCSYNPYAKKMQSLLSCKAADTPLQVRPEIAAARGSALLTATKNEDDGVEQGEQLCPVTPFACNVSGCKVSGCKVSALYNPIHYKGQTINPGMQNPRHPFTQNLRPPGLQNPRHPATENP